MMKTNWKKVEGIERRHKIIRKKISGTKDRPRLNVCRTSKYIYAQIIDDTDGKTLISIYTGSPSIKDKVKKDAGNIKGAALLGQSVAEACKSKGITKVVFDRGGYQYHGRVKALAEAARKGGLQF